MPKIRLTALAIPTLPEGQYWDELCQGLVVMVQKRRRTCWYRGYIGGKERKIRLGHHPALSLADARKRAREVAERIEAGAAPLAPLPHPRSADALSVGALVEKYERHRRREGKNLATFDKVMAAVRKELKPFWSLPAKAFGKQDVRTIRNTMIERNAPIQFNRVRSALRVLFQWASEEDIVETNPVLAVRKSAERSRERVLSEAEIRIVWRACERLGAKGRGVSEPFCRLTRLLLLIGLRRGEAAGIRYRELIGDRLTIPTERTKSGKALTLRLPAKALALLGTGAPDELAFAGPTGGPIRGWSKSLTRLRLACPEIEKGWHLHDLRRTFASHLQRLEVRPDTIELCIGHTLPGLSAHGGVYLRGEQEEAKRVALRLWADDVERIVTTPTLRKLRAT